MKIILFIDCLVSGGAQRQLTSLAVLLKEKGYDVLVALYYDRPFYQKYLEENNVPYEIVETSSKPIKRILDFTIYFRKHKPDWVIAYLDTPSIVACIAKMLGGKFKLLVSERNTTQHMSLLTKVKFNLYRVADYVVPNSITQGKFITEHFSFLARKVNVITNFIDSNKFFPIDHEVNNPKEIICVARVCPQKNVLRFIDAVKIAKDNGARFHVSWYGAEGRDSELAQQRIVEYGISDFFEFKSPDANIVSKYQNSDIFVLPSLFEGFPNVLCEAMSCGLPVLFSNVCDNSLIAKDCVNGFCFDPKNPHQIADALIKVSSLSIDKLHEMGNNSRTIIKENFSQEQFVKQYLNLIDR